METTKLKLNEILIEFDSTDFIIDELRDNKETLNRKVIIMTYYLSDNVNLWTENPLITIIYFDETYKVVKHDDDIAYFNGIYDILIENDLIKKEKIK